MGRAAVVGHVRRLGGRVLLDELRQRAKSHSLEVGLRCDLDRLPALRPAAMHLSMEPCQDSFGGFDQELERTAGLDYGRALHRRRLHRAGLRTLHVAWSADRVPVYVQWLVGPAEWPVLDALEGSFWPRPRQGEVLLEFAYTFVPFRGKGVMSDAMGQLLRIAAAGGASTAYTYVTVDNVPSLRGCAHVGFELDHMKESSRNMGVRRSVIRPPEQAERIAWERNTAPRGPA
jgi:hypothetical protein